MRFLSCLALLMLLAQCSGGGNDDDSLSPSDDDDDIATTANDDDDTAPECTGTQIVWGDECVPNPVFPDRVWVDGEHVRDAQGRQLLLRGTNLSSDRKHSEGYQGWHQREDYLRLSEWGFTAIRHLIGWMAIMPEEGVINEAYLAGLDDRIAWSKEAGVMVILDMHQDLFGEGFGGNGAPRWACDESYYESFTPRTPWYLNYGAPEVVACLRNFYNDTALQDRFAEAWVAVATRYKDDPAVIGFDLMNEPFFANYPVDEFHQEILKPFYLRVATALREAAPNKLIFFEPSTAANLGVAVNFDGFPVENSVYAPHYYQAAVHDGDPYDHRAGPIRDAIARLASEGAALGKPVWVGEFGGEIQAEGWDDYMNDLLGALDDHLAGWAFWDYNRSDNDRGFAMVRSDGSEIAHVTDTLVRPFPRATGGTLEEMHYDPATKEFTMRWRTEPGINAPTELWVPARHYPNGIAISLSYNGESLNESAWEIDGERLVIILPQEPGEASIRVRMKFDD